MKKLKIIRLEAQYKTIEELSLKIFNKKRIYIYIYFFETRIKKKFTKLTDAIIYFTYS